MYHLISMFIKSANIGYLPSIVKSVSNNAKCSKYNSAITCNSKKNFRNR
jgi:hypothetical protein